MKIYTSIILCLGLIVIGFLVIKQWKSDIKHISGCGIGNKAYRIWLYIIFALSYLYLALGGYYLIFSNEVQSQYEELLYLIIGAVLSIYIFQTLTPSFGLKMFIIIGFFFLPIFTIFYLESNGYNLTMIYIIIRDIIENVKKLSSD